MIQNCCSCNKKLLDFCHSLTNTQSSIAQKCDALLRLNDFWESNSPSVKEELYAELCPKIKGLMDRFWEIRISAPDSNGHWLGEKGNGTFYFDDTFLPAEKNTRNGMRWRELVAEYKKDFSLNVDGGVRYSNWRIDLKPYAVASVKIRYEDSDLSKLRNRGGSANTVQEIGAPLFASALTAEIERGGYKDFWEFKDGIKNGVFVRNTPLVIHEDYDGETLLLVPKYLHDNWAHYGGIALVRAIYETLY